MGKTREYWEDRRRGSRGSRVALANLKELREIYSRKEIRVMCKPAAAIVIKKAKELVPVSLEPHKRYSKSTVGGEHKVEAIYHPGNLKRSIGIIPLKKTNYLWVGPRTKDRGKGSGVFKGNRVDGYYAHYVEYGMGRGNKDAKPYMRPAYEQVKGQVVSALIDAFKDSFNKWTPIQL